VGFAAPRRADEQRRRRRPVGPAVNE
jgi:hypothetical protein